MDSLNKLRVHLKQSFTADPLTSMFVSEVQDGPWRVTAITSAAIASHASKKNFTVKRHNSTKNVILIWLVVYGNYILSLYGVWIAIIYVC